MIHYYYLNKLFGFYFFFKLKLTSPLKLLGISSQTILTYVAKGIPCVKDETDIYILWNVKAHDDVNI